MTFPDGVGGGGGGGMGGGKSDLKQSHKDDTWGKYVILRLIYGIEKHNLKRNDI